MYLPLKIPPGMVRPGTLYNARGRWYDGNLVRWHDGVLQPIGGWAALQTVLPSVENVDVGRPIRGMVAFRDNSDFPVLGFGTPDALYLYRAGTLANISPEDLAEGNNDAQYEEGAYGGGAYGVGAYGIGMEGMGVLEDATSWQIDHFGQSLVACSSRDGRLLVKEDPTNSDPAIAMPNAPTQCAGVVVTPERFVLALGADGNDRLIKWCDQGDYTNWTPDDVSQAGDYQITSAGRLLTGARLGRETIILTDADVWRAQYIGGTFVYSITQVSDKGGIIGRLALGTSGNRAFWMGSRSFMTYDATSGVQVIPCPLSDTIFNDLNRLQRSKVACKVRSAYNEVTWHYPSRGANENDSYVTYNYVSGDWYTGKLARTSGVDAAVFGFPIEADPTGLVLQCEVVNGTWDEHGAAIESFVESGPLELGNGDRVMHVREILPDVNTFGDAVVYLIASTYPVTDEETLGPFALAAPTEVRVEARQVRLRIVFQRSDGRVGTFRLDAVPAGRR